MKPATRRDVLRRAGAGLAAFGAASVLRAQDPPADRPGIDARAYLSKILYTRQEVNDWFAGNAFPFASHHPAWGWLLRDARFADGIGGAVSTYTYSSTPFHERRMICHADKPCRINTYGDSFTQCHQVNEGESWQEVLAAHLGEPVRNFGIGAWSVYQAHLRMKHEEARCPADLIVLNIYDDDHYRNLDAWRNIRARKHSRFIEPTLPHLAVNLQTGAVEERPNLCPTKESFYNLCDLDWCVEKFKDDFALGIMLAHANAKDKNPAAAWRALKSLMDVHGIGTRIEEGENLSAAANAVHTEAALAATKKIVEWTEAFAKENKRRVLYVLSYNAGNVARYIKEKSRFDRSFVEFLQARNLPYVDLLEAHAADFAEFSVPVEQYLKRYYIGHYNPLGNFFTAHAIRDKVVAMLDPKPSSYRSP